MNSQSSDEKRDISVFGKNVRAFRSVRGWSIRELASLAGISTRTLVKIEQGRGCTIKVERKVAQALNVFLGRLWDQSIVSEAPQKLIAHGDGRWFFARPEDAAKYHVRMRRTSPDDDENRLRHDPDEIQDENERLRLGLLGLSTGFVQVCGSGISSGFFQFNRGELFGQDVTPPDSSHHPYLLICTKGTLSFTCHGETQILNAGDSMVYEGDDVFIVEPAATMPREELPCTFYFVCLALLPTSGKKATD